jgi:hypothetical protein
MLTLVLRFAIIMFAVLAPSAPHALAKDKIWHIGFLDVNPPPTPDRPSGNVRWFREGLGQLGYEEGRTTSSTLDLPTRIGAGFRR